MKIWGYSQHLDWKTEISWTVKKQKVLCGMKSMIPLWFQGLCCHFHLRDSSLQFLGRKLGISLTFGCSKGIILIRCASVRMENGSGWCWSREWWELDSGPGAPVLEELDACECQISNCPPNYKRIHFLFEVPYLCSSSLVALCDRDLFLLPVSGRKISLLLFGDLVC